MIPKLEIFLGLEFELDEIDKDEQLINIRGPNNFFMHQQDII